MPSKGLPIALTAMLLAAAAMATGTFASSRTPLSSAPQQITIVDTVTGQTSKGDTGTFTASGLTCPSGTFADTNTVGIKLITEHTCGDASGAFDSFLRAVGPQTWRFMGGTSAYSTLRGHAECQTAEGPPITRTCQFLAAFDDVAPTGTVTKFTVARAPGKPYAVHASFTAHDDVAGNAVAFKLRLRVGSRTLATRSGTTTGEAKSFVLKVKAPKGARQLTFTLKLTDPVGNTRTIRRTRRLRNGRLI